MRPIAHKHVVRMFDLSALRSADQAIRAATPDQRAAILNRDEKLCSAIRNALWALGSCKCWYSEASLLEGEGQVEHYRPKRRLWGANHDGYWWRAFDWKNLRLSHPVVNRRMTDYVTGRKAGKGSFFPLINEPARAMIEAEEPNEKPVLLDPVVPSDTQLLTFSLDSGAPTPRYSEERNKEHHQRALDSIEYYHLNEATWNMKRADLMHAVNVLCDRVEEAAAQHPRDDAAYNALVDELIAYLSPFAEFSSACLSVVQERGLLEHVAAGVT